MNDTEKTALAVDEPSVQGGNSYSKYMLKAINSVPNPLKAGTSTPDVTNTSTKKYKNNKSTHNTDRGSAKLRKYESNAPEPRPGNKAFPKHSPIQSPNTFMAQQSTQEEPVSSQTPTKSGIAVRGSPLPQHTANASESRARAKKVSSQSKNNTDEQMVPPSASQHAQLPHNTLDEPLGPIVNEAKPTLNTVENSSPTHIITRATTDIKQPALSPVNKRNIRSVHDDPLLRSHAHQKQHDATYMSLNQYQFDYEQVVDMVLDIPHLIRHNVKTLEKFGAEGVLPFICSWKTQHKLTPPNPIYCALKITTPEREAFTLYINLRHVFQFVDHVFLNHDIAASEPKHHDMLSLCGDAWSTSYWCINHPLTHISMLHTPGVLSQLCSWYDTTSIPTDLKIVDAPLFAKASSAIKCGHPDIKALPDLSTQGCDVLYFRKYVQSWYACLSSAGINYIGCNNKLQAIQTDYHFSWVYATWNRHCRRGVGCGAIKDAMLLLLSISSILARYGPPSIVKHAFLLHQALDKQLTEATPDYKSTQEIARYLDSYTKKMVHMYDNLTFNSMKANSCTSNGCMGYVFNLNDPPLKSVIAQNNRFVSVLLDTEKHELASFLKHAEKITNSLCLAVCVDGSPCFNTKNCAHH